MPHLTSAHELAYMLSALGWFFLDTCTMTFYQHLNDINCALMLSIQINACYMLRERLWRADVLPPIFAWRVKQRANPFSFRQTISQAWISLFMHAICFVTDDKTCGCAGLQKLRVRKVEQSAGHALILTRHRLHPSNFSIAVLINTLQNYCNYVAWKNAFLVSSQLRRSEREKGQLKLKLASEIHRWISIHSRRKN